MGIGVNIKKTLNFLKANGVAATVSEIKGRFADRKSDYKPDTPDEETLEKQRKASGKFPYRPLISIVIPLYNSDREMLEQLLISIFEQSYENFEVVFADGSSDEGLGEFIRHLAPDPAKIIYTHLAENGGISKNTNRAIEMAKGEYIAFADHDDLLCPDALYEVVKAINEHLAVKLSENTESNKEDTDVLSLLPAVIYTDEDKCDESGKKFYAPVHKPDFDPLYLMANNYICHLTVMKADIAKQLMLRPAFDGAQDQDILLRATTGKTVLHIPKVLYHWRVAGNSTSGNTAGKRYAYEAGRKAAAEALENAGINAESYLTMHVGVYGIDFKEEPLVSSGLKNLGYNPGAIGGPVVEGKKTGKVIAGPIPCPFKGLPAAAGGPRNQRFIARGVSGLDLRCIKIAPELHPLFEEVMGIKYSEVPLKDKYDLSMGSDGLHTDIYEWEKIFDFSQIPEDADIERLSSKLCKAIRDKGYSLIYIPEWETVWK